MPLAWGAAGLAAIVAAIAVMFKGGMVAKPKRPLAAGPGSPGGAPNLGDGSSDDDVFRRYPLHGKGPASTQAHTGVIDNGPGSDWGDPTGDPSVSYVSPGDGGEQAGDYSSGTGAAVAGAIASVVSGPAGHPGSGGHAGASVGGVYYSPSPAVQEQQLQNIQSWGGGYVPLGSAPAPYVPGTSSAGGGGSTRI